MSLFFSARTFKSKQKYHIISSITTSAWLQDICLINWTLNKKMVLAQEEKNKLELLFYQHSLFTYYLYKLGQNSIKFLIIWPSLKNNEFTNTNVKLQYDTNNLWIRYHITQRKHLLKKYTTYFGFSFSPVKSI